MIRHNWSWRVRIYVGSGDRRHSPLREFVEIWPCPQFIMSPRYVLHTRQSYLPSTCKSRTDCSAAINPVLPIWRHLLRRLTSFSVHSARHAGMNRLTKPLSGFSVALTHIPVVVVRLRTASGIRTSVRPCPGDFRRQAKALDTYSSPSAQDPQYHRKNCFLGRDNSRRCSSNWQIVGYLRMDGYRILIGDAAPPSYVLRRSR